MLLLLHVTQNTLTKCKWTWRTRNLGTPVNLVLRHDTQNNVSRPPANTILDMVEKYIYLNCKSKIHASYRIQERTMPETIESVHETVYW
jgi:hypothetical protein